MAMLKSLRVGKDPYSRDLKELDRYLREGDRKQVPNEHKQLQQSATQAYAQADTYLEAGHNHQGRCLAFGKTDLVVGNDMYGWSKEFAETRMRAGGKHYENETFYYHYTISPDPRDHASAEETRDLALDWVNKVFPGTQAIVSVHADNKNHIMHAHIVVNAVYPMTGKRIQISKAKSKQMARVCQELCREREMSYMPSELEKNQAERRQRWARSTHAEQDLIDRGIRSWKQDIRDAIDVCVEGAYTWTRFEYLMRERGFKIRVNKNDEITYYHPDSTGYDKRVRSIRLGDAYTKQGVTARLMVDMDALAKGTFIWRKPASIKRPRKYYKPTRRSADPFDMLATNIMVANKRTSLADNKKQMQQNFEALATMRREGITCWEELVEVAKSAKVQAKELAETMEAATNTLARLSDTYEKAIKASSNRDEIAKLPEGFWSISTRHKRNTLENEAQKLEQEVDRVLEMPSVVEKVKEFKLDKNKFNRMDKLYLLVTYARQQMEGAQEANLAEQARLKAIVDAAYHAQKAMFPCDKAKKYEDSKPLKIKKNPISKANKVPTERTIKELEENLAIIAAVKTRQQREELVRKVNKYAPSVPQSTSKAPSVSRTIQNPSMQKPAPNDAFKRPSAEQVKQSVKAARSQNQEKPGSSQQMTQIQL